MARVAYQFAPRRKAAGELRVGAAVSFVRDLFVA
jgi:hypothetical protein